MTENTYTRRNDDNGNGTGAGAGNGRDGGQAVGTVLVTSGTGKTGRRVVERLTALGVPVRSGSRSASRTGEAPFDWQDDTGWATALHGAEAAYVAYYPDLAVPGAAEAMAVFGRTAAACGVRRVVLLSGRGEPQAAVAEEALREAAGTVEVTVVRSAFFAQNFSEGALLDGVLGGELVFPAGTTAEPFLDLDDLADVVVAALTEEGHAGAVYELTGPRALTFARAAEELGRAAGRPVRYAPVTGPAYASLLERFGVPGPEAGFLAELFATLLDGHNAATTDGVKRVLGREPKDFTAFAREAAADGVWHG
ncbi:NmrA family transcriptional regulator [Streptomyces sp. SID14515]|uniref:NmrA family transcriptional regulator n=1 Tax=Streptomyces sp. SID14515 TaxID=2706074 RepID=UPI0013C5BE6E|nr:NmrA family transcriptional regulator [Streptomyces sp. SID14515]NEB42000.1 NmrA family transcriptional regulator [Streptomyces sp. SID14515]